MPQDSAAPGGGRSFNALTLKQFDPVPLPSHDWQVTLFPKHIGISRADFWRQSDYWPKRFRSSSPRLCWLQFFDEMLHFFFRDG